MIVLNCGVFLYNIDTFLMKIVGVGATEKYFALQS